MRRSNDICPLSEVIHGAGGVLFIFRALTFRILSLWMRRWLLPSDRGVFLAIVSSAAPPSGLITETLSWSFQVPFVDATRPGIISVHDGMRSCLSRAAARSLARSLC